MKGKNIQDSVKIWNSTKYESERLTQSKNYASEQIEKRGIKGGIKGWYLISIPILAVRRQIPAFN
jgi:hypothetical protein